VNRTTTAIIAGLIAVVIVGGGIYGVTAKQTADKAAKAKEVEAMKVKATEAMKAKDAAADATAPDGDIMKKDAAKPGAYLPYSEQTLAATSGGKAVIFFAATWCPTCKALNADITANLPGIPAGVTILKADYDTSVALKQKYGVTMQHTLVQVDPSGNQLKKWTGSPTLAALAAQVN
jgi:thiol-disulfide isomerase/thioredoxin